MKLTKQDRALLAFVATLTTVILLSKIGGTGGDLAIMTGLVGVLGMLAQRMGEEPKATGKPDDPQHIVEEQAP